MNRKALNAAKRGAAFLDGRYKTWRRRVDVERLDQARGGFAPQYVGSCGCVLSQLDASLTREKFGSYERRADMLGLSDAECERLGFAGAGLLADYTWADLNEAWQRVLA